jgi:hypothetical protein
MLKISYEEQEVGADILDKMKDPVFVAHPSVIEELRSNNMPFITMLEAKNVPIISADMFVDQYSWFFVDRAAWDVDRAREIADEMESDHD